MVLLDWDTASETNGGQSDDREYSTKAICSGSELYSSSGDDEDTVGSGGDGRCEAVKEQFLSGFIF